MMDQQQLDLAKALGRIPSGLYILTARHEDRREGILVSWVQQVCFQPPMVSVAVAKGRPIMPLISESRRFALCQLPEGDRVLMRKFAGGATPGEDHFLGYEMVNHSKLNLPILAGSLSYLECEVSCHIDVDGDHDLFVGIVRAGKYLAGAPMVHLREDGMRY
ncbi:MAG: flavin reductase family protein [Phycisphaeraceae bacterium]|nr:flavin reductase family protein [Phycisphaeraceae bacterium]